jgi:hypothetical protein
VFLGGGVATSFVARAARHSPPRNDILIPPRNDMQEESFNARAQRR